MKKLIFSTLWILIWLCLNISTAHAQNCLDVYFDNGDGMCLNMNKNGNNYKIYPTRYFWLNNQNVVCYVILPNNVMQRLDSCKGTFTYNGNWTQSITISAMYNANNTIYNNRLPASVNFNDGSWSWRTYPIDYSKYSNNYNNSSNNTTHFNINKCNNNCNSCNKNCNTNYITDTNHYYRTSNTTKVETPKGKTYNNKLELESNDLFPDIDQWINLTIETDDDYTGSLYIYAKYRSPINTQRVSIDNRSSTYFYDYSTTRSNGKYEMIKSDDGEIKLKNLIKFKKYGDYRIYVKDRFGKESYIQFSVENTKSKSHPYSYGYNDYDNYNKISHSNNRNKHNNNSSSNEFTSHELDKIREIHDNRDHTIAQLQRLYPNLKKDYYWITLSNNFANDMKDIVNDKRYKNLDDYDDFLDAYNDWYRYTMQNI